MAAITARKSASKSTKSAKPAKIQLPEGVLVSDTKYPDHKRVLPYDYNNRDAVRSLTFYQVEGRGWVITTLHISNPSRRQAAGTAARTYGIECDDEGIVTVGRGPHVTAEVTVHLSKDNIGRLQKYVDLHTKGMASACQIRDRISTRRANTISRRGSFGGLFGF